MLSLAEGSFWCVHRLHLSGVDAGPYTSKEGGLGCQTLEIIREPFRSVRLCPFSRTADVEGGIFNWDSATDLGNYARNRSQDVDALFIIRYRNGAIKVTFQSFGLVEACAPSTVDASRHGARLTNGSIAWAPGVRYCQHSPAHCQEEE
ncbi:hypothetical protein HG531_009250 [Fusarium graminearum]|nr:hypothetical protein HG531_009250 [Fusarium graminearum]